MINLMEEGVGIIRKELIKIVVVCEFIFYQFWCKNLYRFFRDAVRYVVWQFPFSDRKVKPSENRTWVYVRHNREPDEEYLHRLCAD